MKDLILSAQYRKEHKVIIVTTVLGMPVGAFGGVMVYYPGWLG